MVLKKRNFFSRFSINPEYVGMVYDHFWESTRLRYIALHDGADQGGYSRGYKVFFKLCGADELKNRANGAIWSYLPSVVIY